MHVNSKVPVVRHWDITPEQEAAFRETDKTFAWLCDMPQELLHQHAGQWVAAKDCRIVAAGPTMEAMFDQLGDVDIQTVVIDHIDRPGWTIRR